MLLMEATTQAQKLAELEAARLQELFRVDSLMVIRKVMLRVIHSDWLMVIH